MQKEKQTNKQQAHACAIHMRGELTSQPLIAVALTRISTPSGLEIVGRGVEMSSNQLKPPSTFKTGKLFSGGGVGYVRDEFKRLVKLSFGFELSIIDCVKIQGSPGDLCE